MRAASRARAASIAFVTIRFESAGFSSRNSASFRLTASLTKPSIGGLPSLVFVWPSNCGSWSFTEITAVRPSRESSPLRFWSFSLSSPFSRAYAFRVLVRAERKPERCEPPSCVLMLLANEKTDSW